MQSFGGSSHTLSMPVREVQGGPASVIAHLVSGFTHMLICKFASQSSRPEKIRDWISYLEQLSTRHGSDSEARQMLQRLLDEARSWEREIAAA